MLCKLGFVIFSLGVMMADSANLIIPITVALVGAAMMLTGKEDDGDDR